MKIKCGVSGWSQMSTNFWPQTSDVGLSIPDIHEAQNTPLFYVLVNISINTPSFKNLRDSFLTKGP